MQRVGVNVEDCRKLLFLKEFGKREKWMNGEGNEQYEQKWVLVFFFFSECFWECVTGIKEMKMKDG